MDSREKKFQRGKVRRYGQTFALVGAVAGLLFVAGCGKIPGFGVTQVEARTDEHGIEAFLTYQEALLGKGPAAVEAVFGQPKGIFERQKGKIWMYARWCVEFDSQGRVVRMERDIAATGTGGRAPRPSMALAKKPVQPSPPSASPVEVTKVSNGGQPVNLSSLIQPGKITVLDFYADWCGPCQRIAPLLERLASENPDVALIKVDIVRWGTPVAQQHNINSIPNIRVYDRSGNPVGEPTSSFLAVQSYVEKARG